MRAFASIASNVYSCDAMEARLNPSVWSRTLYQGSDFQTRDDIFGESGFNRVVADMAEVLGIIDTSIAQKYIRLGWMFEGAVILSPERGYDSLGDVTLALSPSESAVRTPDPEDVWETSSPSGRLRDGLVQDDTSCDDVGSCTDSVIHFFVYHFVSR